MAEYRACELLRHGVTDQLIRPGEPVDVGHLSPDQVGLLVARGMIEPVKGPKARQGRGPDESQAES